MKFAKWKDPLDLIPEIPRHPSISAENIERGYKSPLPSVCDENTDYTLDLKERAILVLNQYKPSTESDDDTAKVLGTFIDYLPSEGQVVLMQEINDYADDPKRLRQLRNFMVDAILKPMKVAGAQSPHVPRVPHSEFENEMDKDQSELRQQCLKRDNNRCVLRGIVDYEQDMAPDQCEDVLGGPIQCAHILPFALAQFDEKKATKARKKTVIWWALHRYSPGLKDVIQSSTINQEGNVMMLYQPIHAAFGDYYIALEPLEKGYYTEIRHPDVVEFVQHDPSVAMPTRVLLRVHYIIAKILEVSGVGARIDRTGDARESLIYDNIIYGSPDLGYVLAAALLVDI
ncbi:hypothetical protein QBC37DRAFT_287317 [Rhypophila decipiens]|uniref:HNH nuclease domain-containing protein n=1 Tax=Rhypophila decipiens TaxID=261697 RepID=A0AAN6Y9Z6_9PEZI|nr:hypothetical protein QBC37DRAFT_287317 [Rhypophila decipiens]